MENIKRSAQPLAYQQRADAANNLGAAMNATPRMPPRFDVLVDEFGTSLATLQNCATRLQTMTERFCGTADTNNSPTGTRIENPGSVADRIESRLQDFNRLLSVIQSALERLESL